MMYFTTHLNTYSPKNRSCAELIEWVGQYEYVLIENDLALDALKEEFRHKVEELNTKYPKVKEIKLTVDKETIRALVYTNGCPEEIFILSYHRVKSTYSFSELLPANPKQIESEKGGQL